MWPHLVLNLWALLSTQSADPFCGPACWTSPNHMVRSSYVLPASIVHHSVIHRSICPSILRPIDSCQSPKVQYLLQGDGDFEVHTFHRWGAASPMHPQPKRRRNELPEGARIYLATRYMLERAQHPRKQNNDEHNIKHRCAQFRRSGKILLSKQ